MGSTSTLDARRRGLVSPRMTLEAFAVFHTDDAQRPGIRHSGHPIVGATARGHDHRNGFVAGIRM